MPHRSAVCGIVAKALAIWEPTWTDVHHCLPELHCQVTVYPAQTLHNPGQSTLLCGKWTNPSCDQVTAIGFLNDQGRLWDIGEDTQSAIALCHQILPVQPLEGSELTTQHAPIPISKSGCWISVCEHGQTRYLQYEKVTREKSRETHDKTSWHGATRPYLAKQYHETALIQQTLSLGPSSRSGHPKLNLLTSTDVWSSAFTSSMRSPINCWCNKNTHS